MTFQSSEYQNYLRTQTNLSSRTIDKYLYVAKAYFAGNEELTIPLANAFITSKIGQGRNYYIRAAFYHIFSFLGRPNDFRMVVKIKQRQSAPKGNYLNSEDLSKIVNSLTLKHQLIAAIQFTTGSRASDAIGIKTSNCRLEGNELRIRMKVKGGGERVVFVPESYAEKLNDYIKLKKLEYPFLENGYSDKDMYNAYQTYWKELREKAKTLGFKFSTHDFKRNFLNDMTSITKDIREVFAVSGHKNIETTLRYLNKHSEPEKVRDLTRKIRR